MALAQEVINYISVEDYLEQEEKSSILHEYVAGRIFAMSGASDFHNLIGGNLFALLRSHIRGTSCFVYQSGMKVRVEVTDIFYYPDVFVTCEPAKANTYFKEKPCLIIEILSPSTEIIDRREKLVNYFKLESLREYALVSQDQMRIDIYRRTDLGKLELEILGPEDVVSFDSIPPAPIKMTMTEVYEGLMFD